MRTVDPRALLATLSIARRTFAPRTATLAATRRPIPTRALALAPVATAVVTVAAIASGPWPCRIVG